MLRRILLWTLQWNGATFAMSIGQDALPNMIAEKQEILGPHLT